MQGMDLLEVLGIKPEFKVCCEGDGEGVKTTVMGNKMLAEAGVLSIVESMAKADDKSAVEILEGLLSVAKMHEILSDSTEEVDKDPEEDDEPEDCDGNCDECDRHKNMPEALRKLFDSIFGDNKEDEE